MIRRLSGTTYPATTEEGDLVYFNTGTNTADTDLDPNTTYSYSAWSWVEGSDVWSDSPEQPPTPRTTWSAPGAR